MRPSVPDIHITDRQEAEFAAYRPLAVQAVLGLICGLLAPLAVVDPLLYIIPILGALFSGWAIRRIKKNSRELTGRKMAMAGFMLSLLVLAAVPADSLVYRAIVRGEARQFSALWFKYLTQDEPLLAHQLTEIPKSRRPLDPNLLWTYYRDAPRAREELENYVKLPTVRTLLALGPKAQARFYQTTGQSCINDTDQVEQLYAITYEEGGERKSFFVAVQLSRQKLQNGAGWRITSANGGVRPEGW